MLGLIPLYNNWPSTASFSSFLNNFTNIQQTTSTRPSPSPTYFLIDDFFKIMLSDCFSSDFHLKKATERKVIGNRTRLLSVGSSRGMDDKGHEGAVSCDSSFLRKTPGSFIFIFFFSHYNFNITN